MDQLLCTIGSILHGDLWLKPVVKQADVAICYSSAAEDTAALYILGMGIA
jgi:hypothetical protein